MDLGPFIPALALIAAAVLWYALAPLLQIWLQRSEAPIASRLAEFPYALRNRLFYLIIVFALLAGTRPLFSELEKIGPGFIQPAAYDYAQCAVLVVIRLLVGVALWLCVFPALELVRTEFVERNLNKYGSGQRRNTALLIYYFTIPVVLGLIIALVAYLLNFDVTAATIALGSAGVAGALALQHILANVFAGFTLALDTPFSRGDLIRVGSDKTYEVRKRGIRITTVRDVDTHEIVYLPNQSLITQPIVDVTQPTDDLRAVIRVSVPYGSDLRDVRTILSDIANGHPHVIGAIDKKRESISKKVFRLYVRRVFNECKEHYLELARIAAEDALNGRIRDLRRRLENWAAFVDKYEDKGFDRDERKWLDAFANELDRDINDLRQLTTQWLILFRNCVAKGRVIVFRREEGVPDRVWKADTQSVKRMVGRVLSSSEWTGTADKVWKPLSGINGQHKDTVEAMVAAAQNADEQLVGLVRLRQHEKVGSENLNGALDDYIDALEALRNTELLQIQFQKWSEDGEEPKVDYVADKLQWLSAAIRSAQQNITAIVKETNAFARAPELEHRLRPALIDADKYPTVPGGTVGNSTEFLRSLSKTIEYDLDAFVRRPDTVWRPGNWYCDTKLRNSRSPDAKSSYVNAFEYVHTAFEVAHALSDLANIPPERRELKNQYLRAAEAENEIRGAYDALGQVYVDLMRDAARWIARDEKPADPDLIAAQQAEVRAESGVSIALCRTRTENLYISNQAANHFLDHPLLEALAGRFPDEDERADLVELFRMWGDKIEQLLRRQRHIVAKLKEAKSTTIDSDLRELSEWLKIHFKEPYPSWKYPLAPIENFEDSGVTVSMKFYIDNVRMDKYLRAANAFTQMRLRIYERLNNAGIDIPYPQRDVNVRRPVSVIVTRDGNNTNTTEDRAARLLAVGKVQNDESEDPNV